MKKSSRAARKKAKKQPKKAPAFFLTKYMPKALPKIVAAILPWFTLLIFLTIVTIGAFSGGLWGGVGIGCSLVLYLGTAYLDGRWPRPARDIFQLALLALVIIALLNLHSINADVSWYNWLRLVTIFLPLMLLTSPEILVRADHKNLFSLTMIAAFAGCFALGIELLLGAPVMYMAQASHAHLTNYNRGISYLIVFALAILAAIWSRPLVAAPVTVTGIAQKAVLFTLFIMVLLLPASFTESRAAKLALIAALVVAAAAHLAPKWTRNGLTGLIILLFAWPLVLPRIFMAYKDHLVRIPDSWRARIEIWDYMSYRIAERPVLGWGLGTSKLLDFRNPHGELYKFVTEAAPHPHNVVTQLWVELGLPGLILGAMFAILMLRQAANLSKPLVPFAFGAWAAALCLSLVSYNFWTDSMFAAFALTGLAFAILEKRMQKDRQQLELG